MPGPFEELEKEAENLEKQSKEKFNQKNFVAAISLLEEAIEIYSKLGYHGKIRMINKRIFQLKNLVKFEKRDTVVKTKGEIEFQDRVDKVLGEKERHNSKKLAEQKVIPPEMKKKLEKINLLVEKAEKEEKLGKYQRVIGRYEYLLELYKSIPKEIINYSKEIYEIEKKIAMIREKL
jgi:tetratricopeptide (TPR) repeat protein